MKKHRCSFLRNTGAFSERPKKMRFINCTQCGQANPAGAKYCINCGAEVPRAESPADNVNTNEGEAGFFVRKEKPTRPFIPENYGKKKIDLSSIDKKTVLSGSAILIVLLLLFTAVVKMNKTPDKGMPETSGTAAEVTEAGETAGGTVPAPVGETRMMVFLYGAIGTSDKLYLYNDTALTGEPTAKLSHMENVTVSNPVETSGEWIRVTTDSGVTGWVLRQYVWKDVPRFEYAKTTLGAVSMFTSPKTTDGSRLITNLEPHTTVFITAEPVSVNGWTLVKYNGNYGWIADSVLENVLG